VARFESHWLQLQPKPVHIDENIPRTAPSHVEGRAIIRSPVS
jgi:hypothetical protein